MSLIGVDIGTSGVRALAVTAEGKPLAELGRPTTLRRPAPGHAELDAESVLESVTDVLHDLTARPSVQRDPPDALSFSILGEAVVGVDAEGRALGPAPVGMDQRGTAAATRVRDHLGEERFQRLTGQPLHPMFSVYKVADWAATGARVRCFGEFVATRLGAKPAIDSTMAARTGAYDVEMGTWSAEIADAAGVPTTIWPDVVPVGSVIGTIRSAAAAATGLRTGTPIVVGSHDQASGYWGAGGRIGRIAVLAFGSSDCLTVATAGRPPLLPGTGLATYPTGTGVWVTLAGTAAGGWSLTWWTRTAGANHPDEVAGLLNVPSPTPPRLLVLPYLAGSGTLDNDAAARGAIIGLTLETTRAELTRAFLEASGYEVARIMEALRECGIDVGDVRAIGTGSQYVTALQLRASAAGVSLRAVPGNAAARGAALQAGIGIGTHRSLTELPEPALDPLGPAIPRDQDWYSMQRRRYTDLATALAPLSHELSDEASAPAANTMQPAEVRDNNGETWP